VERGGGWSNGTGTIASEKKRGRDHRATFWRTVAIASILYFVCLFVWQKRLVCLQLDNTKKKERKKRKKRKEKRIFQSINMYRYVSMYIGAVSSRLMRRYWYDSAGMNGGNSHVSDGGRWFPSRLSSLVWIGRMELEVRLPPPPPPPPPPTVNYADLIDDTKEKKRVHFLKISCTEKLQQSWNNNNNNNNISKKKKIKCDF